MLRWTSLLIRLLILSLFLGWSDIGESSQADRVRYFTRPYEFDYGVWTANAIGIKLIQSSLGSSSYIPVKERRDLVFDYLKLIEEIQRGEAQVNEIYTDPAVKDPFAASATLRTQLDEQYDRRALLAPLTESILQSQVSTIAAEAGLTLGGQPIPPVLYHISPLPLALIVSPRNVIRQDAQFSLVPEMTLDQQVALEDKVEQTLDVSTLVVPVGGIGIYPTMVMQTTDLNWLSEVITHEWIHNYLTLRPLGISYYDSDALRTMNETAATIAGKELGLLLVEQFYPEKVPPPSAPPKPPSTAPQQPAKPPPFDFRKEMHTTRVTVDQLLEEGKIDEAEEYMEARRQLFWENGYHIRKLNQAYFAFYGAYADLPGGAAGEDPVGAAVRALRARSRTLAEFINRMSWMSSFEQLKKALEEGS
jgi:hypothetical protein